MYIETMAQGLALIDAVGSPRFRLHIDLCHAYCSERDYVAALGEAAPHARYLHISDARAGYNLKIVEDAEELAFDPGLASTLVSFPDTADYLLVDRDHPLYFCDQAPDRRRWQRIDAMLARAGVRGEVRTIAYARPAVPACVLDAGILTYRHQVSPPA